MLEVNSDACLILPRRALSAQSNMITFPCLNLAVHVCSALSTCFSLLVHTDTSPTLGPCSTSKVLSSSSAAILRSGAMSFKHLPPARGSLPRKLLSEAGCKSWFSEQLSQ